MRVLASAFVAAVLLLGAQSARAEKEPDRQPPVFHHVPVTTAVQGDEVTVTTEIEDDSDIFAPLLWYRYPGTTTYSSTDLVHKTGKLWAATVPAPEAGIDYWLEAYDGLGNGPAREGSPEQPFHITVNPKPPVYKEPQITEVKPETVTPAPAVDVKPVTAPANPQPAATVDAGKADKSSNPSAELAPAAPATAALVKVDAAPAASPEAAKVQPVTAEPSLSADATKKDATTVAPNPPAASATPVVDGGAKPSEPAAVALVAPAPAAPEVKAEAPVVAPPAQVAPMQVAAPPAPTVSAPDANLAEKKTFDPASLQHAPEANPTNQTDQVKLTPSGLEAAGDLSKKTPPIDGGLEQPPAVDSTPIYKKWWAITGATVVVGAAVGVLVYALQPSTVQQNVFSTSLRRP